MKRIFLVMFVLVPMTAHAIPLWEWSHQNYMREAYGCPDDPLMFQWMQANYEHEAYGIPKTPCESFS